MAAHIETGAVPDITALIDMLGARSVHLLAQGLSAKTALHTAKTDSRVHAVILTDPDPDEFEDLQDLPTNLLLLTGNNEAGLRTAMALRARHPAVAIAAISDPCLRMALIEQHLATQSGPRNHEPGAGKKIERLPRLPGIYQHKDAEGNVLYVGKAKNLRSRVRSYFRESRPHDGRLRIMIRKVEDVEVIVTDTEAEALILENNLIKHLKPRYNVLLRDDKTFPFICIRNERFPRVFPTRRIVRDGSKYFGPYTDVKNMHLMLRTIRSIFQLRTCNLNLAPEPIAAGKYDACLEYHIKKCAAPCTGQQSEADYNRTIEQSKNC